MIWKIDLSELSLISKILSSISEGISSFFKINHVKIKQDKLIDKYTENKEIIKTIYVKDKIINVIIR